MINRFLILLCSALAFTLIESRAWAEIHIIEARYEAGVLRVVGDTDSPYTKVTLDSIYEEKTDSAGEFVFRVRYKPHGCIADVRVEDEIFSTVVSNCIEPGNPGTPARRPAR